MRFTTIAILCLSVCAVAAHGCKEHVAMELPTAATEGESKRFSPQPDELPPTHPVLHGPPIAPPSFPQDHPLLGDWEAIEVIAEDGKAHDVKVEPVWVRIEPETISMGPVRGFATNQVPCKIVGNTIDLDMGGSHSPKGKVIWKGIYELKDGELRIAWAMDIRGRPQDRPNDFTVAKDGRWCRYALRKMAD